MGFVGNILHRSVPHEKYNILAWPTHEAYFYNLAKTDHNFWLLQGEGINTWKEWNRPIPKNVVILDKDIPPPMDIRFDFILSQNKFGQIQKALDLSKYLHLPIVNIEHTWPADFWPKQQVGEMKKMAGHINIFISDISRHQWGWKQDEATVIHHGIDSKFFAPNKNITRANHLLSVVNDWPNRDYFCGFNLWREVSRDLPVFVLGDSPGLSKPSKNFYELKQAYQNSSIFLNTSLRSPIPTVVLEAASSGCAIVSTSNCMTPEIFTHGYDAMVSNNPADLRTFCIDLLNNPKECERLGNNARNTIVEFFSLDRFVNEWNEVFKTAANLTYKG